MVEAHHVGRELDLMIDTGYYISAECASAGALGKDWLLARSLPLSWLISKAQLSKMELTQKDIRFSMISIFSIRHMPTTHA